MGSWGGGPWTWAACLEDCLSLSFKVRRKGPHWWGAWREGWGLFRAGALLSGPPHPLLQTHLHVGCFPQPRRGGEGPAPARPQLTLSPPVLGRKQHELSPSSGSRWVAGHQPDVETRITPPNYPRIWKLFVPPTFPLGPELISPLALPPQAGAWGHRGSCAPENYFSSPIIAH